MPWIVSGSSSSAPTRSAGRGRRTGPGRRTAGAAQPRSSPPGAARSAPPNRMPPSAETARTQRASVVLPEPDSPTMPKTSPWRTSRETPSRATCLVRGQHRRRRRISCAALDPEQRVVAAAQAGCQRITGPRLACRARASARWHSASTAPRARPRPAAERRAGSPRGRGRRRSAAQRSSRRSARPGRAGRRRSRAAAGLRRRGGGPPAAAPRCRGAPDGRRPRRRRRSTIRPAYITQTVSQKPATMPRSWVMKITAQPCCSAIRRSRPRIWAWVVTSRAVVGSSAIRTRGRWRSRWRSSPAGASRPRTGAGTRRPAARRGRSRPPAGARRPAGGPRTGRAWSCTAGPR